ncbi:MAG TPA: hypothetical protein VL137_10165, partial [Polyangiaceae bacterium]|nr:hypothetical protein [Polyangiaceae bacterium]
ERAGEVIGGADLAACSGFLWVKDEAVRERLLSKRQTADLFLDASPREGLLIAPLIDFDKLVRHCRAIGVEVMRDGQVVRTGSTAPPPSRSGSAPRGPRRQSAAAIAALRRAAAKR